MELLPSLCLVCVAFTGLTKGVGVLQDGPLNKTVGETVMFTTKLTPHEQTFLTVIWNFCSTNIFTLSGGSNITAPGYEGRITVFMSTGSLELRNLSHSDSGEYNVNIIPSGAAVAGNTKLAVYDGPENINLTKYPSQENYAEGSDINLTCSADSRPAAQFTWFLNGELLSDTGPELRLMNIQRNQSGSYSCQAFNSKTLRSLMCQSSVVSVLERISGTSITSSTNLPIEGNSDNLTCEALGSVFTREWKKGGSDLTLTEDMTLLDGNRVLSFSRLNRKHNGIYSCNISNPLSSEEAKYTMDVIYGPEKVQITGPHDIKLEETLTLKCSAESSPPATYIWKLNRTEIHKSAVLTKNNTGLSDSGSYICEAMNPITGEKTSSTAHKLTVTDNIIDPQPVCGPGCIAGIVIAVLVVCAAAGGGGFYFYKKKQTENTPTVTTTSTRTRGEGQDNSAYSGREDVNYADISFFQNKDGGTVQMGPQNNTSEYAQVKVNNPSSPPGYEAHMERAKGPAPQPNEVYAQVRKN